MISALSSGLDAAKGIADVPEQLDPDRTSYTPMDPLQVAGHVIGRYHLLQKIGEGGMGEVWLAEQKEPVRRRLALKLIKTGMNSREVIARLSPSNRLWR